MKKSVVLHLVSVIVLFIYLYIAIRLIRAIPFDSALLKIIGVFVLSAIFGVYLRLSSIFCKGRIAIKINIYTLLFLALPVFILLLVTWGGDILIFSGLVKSIAIDLPSVLKVFRDSIYGLYFLSIALGYFVAESFFDKE